MYLDSLENILRARWWDRLSSNFLRRCFWRRFWHYWSIWFPAATSSWHNRWSWVFRCWASLAFLSFLSLDGRGTSGRFGWNWLGNFDKFSRRWSLSRFKWPIIIFAFRFGCMMSLLFLLALLFQLVCQFFLNLLVFFARRIRDAFTVFRLKCKHITNFKQLLYLKFILVILGWSARLPNYLWNVGGVGKWFLVLFVLLLQHFLIHFFSLFL